MQSITNKTELAQAIKMLEVEQASNGVLLRDQFFQTFESLKPINLIKSTLLEISRSPFVANNLLSTVIGMAGGYLSKKVLIGNSGNVLMKLFGAVLQFGVSNAVSRHPEAILSIGRFLQNLFSSKHEHKLK